MPDPTVAVDLLEPADVGIDGTAEVALHDDVVLQDLGDLGDLFLSELAGLDVPVDPDLFDDLIILIVGPLGDHDTDNDIGTHLAG